MGSALAFALQAKRRTIKSAVDRNSGKLVRQELVVRQRAARNDYHLFAQAHCD
jgi:hypothetical protein